VNNSTKTRLRTLLAVMPRSRARLSVNGKVTEVRRIR